MARGRLSGVLLVLLGIASSANSAAQQTVNLGRATVMVGSCTGKPGCGELATLEGVKADAEAMHQLLSASGYAVQGKPGSHDVNRAELDRRLAIHASAPRGLVYFSGHCEREADGHKVALRLVLSDGQRVPFSQLVKQGGQRLYLLDCCFSAEASLGRVQGRHHLLAAGRGKLRTGGGKTSPYTRALLQAIRTGRADKNCDSWVSLKEASLQVDLAHVGRRHRIGRGQLTSLKSTGPGDPVLARVPADILRSNAQYTKRCSPWRAVVARVRRCVDRPQCKAGASPGVEPWCSAMPCALRQRLREALEGKDPAPLSRPVWLVRRHAGVPPAWLARLTARLTSSGHQVVELPLPLPGRKDQELYRWLPTALWRFASVLQLSVTASPGGDQVVEVTDRESGELLLPLRHRPGAPTTALLNKILQLSADHAAGVDLDRLLPVMLVGQEPGRDLVARFRYQPPLKVRLTLDRKERCRGVPVPTEHHAVEPCQHRVGHCVRISFDKHKQCREALGKAHSVQLRGDHGHAQHK